MNDENLELGDLFNESDYNIICFSRNGGATLLCIIILGILLICYMTSVEEKTRNYQNLTKNQRIMFALMIQKCETWILAILGRLYFSIQPIIYNWWLVCLFILLTILHTIWLIFSILSDLKMTVIFDRLFSIKVCIAAIIQIFIRFIYPTVIAQGWISMSNCTYFILSQVLVLMLVLNSIHGSLKNLNLSVMICFSTILFLDKALNIVDSPIDEPPSFIWLASFFSTHIISMCLTYFQITRGGMLFLPNSWRIRRYDSFIKKIDIKI